MLQGIRGTDIGVGHPAKVASHAVAALLELLVVAEPQLGFWRHARAYPYFVPPAFGTNSPAVLLTV